MSQDEDSAQARDAATGRFRKGYSGNANGRPRKTNAADAFDLPTSVLETAALEIDVKSNGGPPQRLPALDIILRKLALSAAQGDKAATRLFMTYMTAATKTAEARMQQRAKRLGDYLKSVDEGRPWRLDEAEAEFLQAVANEIGIPTTITANEGQSESITPQEVESLATQLDIWRAFGSKVALPALGVRRDVVFRILTASRTTAT